MFDEGLHSQRGVSSRAEVIKTIILYIFEFPLTFKQFS